MKKLFRFTAAATALALSAALFACAKKDDKKPSTDSTPSKPAVQQNSTVSTNGYESLKYNLRFTPPDGYIMFFDTESTTASPAYPKHEMSSNHSSGYPFVTVIVEKSDAETVDEFLGGMSLALSTDDSYTPEFTDCEIAGRVFRSCTVSSPESTKTFYAEKIEEGYLYITIITIDDGAREEVISAFSAF